MSDEFKRIMLPIDFSVHSDRATQYATWFAQVAGGTIYLVHVIANPADPLYEPEEVPHWVMVDHAEKKARKMLEAAAQESLSPSCPREFHVSHGDPYERLLQAAEVIKPDVIVMSTHGRGGVAHLVIGSVAEKLVRHAPCPVFVVGRQTVRDQNKEKA